MCVYVCVWCVNNLRRKLKTCMNFLEGYFYRINAGNVLTEVNCCGVENQICLDYCIVSVGKYVVELLLRQTAW